jgi:hypothetical protein
LERYCLTIHQYIEKISNLDLNLDKSVSKLFKTINVQENGRIYVNNFVSVIYYFNLNPITAYFMQQIL